MIDAILIFVLCAAFYGGFKAGSKYQTFKSFGAGIKAWFYE